MSFLFEIILNRFVKFKIFVQELVFYPDVHMRASADVASIVLALKPFGGRFYAADSVRLAGAVSLSVSR